MIAKLKTLEGFLFGKKDVEANTLESIVSSLKEVFEKVNEEINIKDAQKLDDINSFYSKCKDKIAKLSKKERSIYNPEIVERIVKSMEESYGEHEGFGILVSALTNFAMENTPLITEKKIRLRFSRIPDWVGFRFSEGELEISGVYPRQASHIGAEMNGGKMIVKYDVGAYAGKGMSGGTMIIDGSAGNNLGEGMNGGEIIVKGFCHEGAGHNMRDGHLFLLGGAKRGLLGEGMRGGKMYINCFNDENAISLEKDILKRIKNNRIEGGTFILGRKTDDTQVKLTIIYRYGSKMGLQEYYIKPSRAEEYIIIGDGAIKEFVKEPILPLLRLL